MSNDRQTLFEQILPEEIARYLVNTNNNQQSSASQASYQCQHSESNIQEESNYIDSWYDGLIGTSED
ncbi:MAG: hypothetical protein F6K31_35410 [Symploca sp. SIO2G7]|nr:hypothetical protein [Symploca sp. SIO2G7]